MLVLLLVGPGSVVTADIYRWVDENGVVNYSQSAPEGARAVERVQTSSGSRVRNQGSSPAAAGARTGSTGANSGAAAASALTEEQQAMRAALEAEEREQLAQLAADRADACRKNRALLSDLTQYARIRVEDPDGTVRILPDEERRARIDDVQARIVEYCSAG